jgi:DNA repair protein RadA/Sms
MKAPKAVFVCQECGAQSPKWLGRCTECGAWNSLVEESTPAPSGAPVDRRDNRYAQFGSNSNAKLYAEVEDTHAARLSTGIGEFDRVLGGGVVPGSLVLLGGEPGIGKSTLLLQAAGHFAREVGPVLYASGEESEHQIKSRGDRLGIGAAPLYLLSETCIERILEEIARLKPALVVIDSIQTVFSIKFQSAPGSIGQVREAATQFLFAAKGQNIPTVLVGHVTKDGSLAGPKVLEHVVDTVLYFEGERHHSHRVVRAVKNRFGAVSELGVFEMTGAGLRPVANPSKLFLSERASGTPGLGRAVLRRRVASDPGGSAGARQYQHVRQCAAHGDRDRSEPAVVAACSPGKTRRAQPCRRRCLRQHRGGMSVDEPAADLSVAAAVASSVRNRSLAPATAMFGEIGLSGEIRGIPQAPLRIREAVQMGFTRVVMPAANLDPEDGSAGGAELVGVRTVGEALDALI